MLHFQDKYTFCIQKRLRLDGIVPSLRDLFDLIYLIIPSTCYHYRRS